MNQTLDKDNRGTKIYLTNTIQTDRQYTNIHAQATMITLYFSSAPQFRKMSIYAPIFSCDRESPSIVSSTRIMS